MAAAGYLTSPRGQRAVYLHSRDSHTAEMPDYVYNSESDEDSSDDFAGIVQSTLNTYSAADFSTVEVDEENETFQVLLYNPITDGYDIKPGQYVL